MVLCLCQLLAGSHRVTAFPLDLLQVSDARADLGETLTDLLAAGLPAVWLVVHTSSMPGSAGCVTVMSAHGPRPRARPCPLSGRVPLIVRPFILLAPSMAPERICTISLGTGLSCLAE
jgi:hypothetical protein